MSILSQTTGNVLLKTQKSVTKFRAEIIRLFNGNLFKKVDVFRVFELFFIENLDQFLVFESEIENFTESPILFQRTIFPRLHCILLLLASSSFLTKVYVLLTLADPSFEDKCDRSC